MSKSGRVRCGQCERVLWDATASRGLDHRERAADARLTGHAGPWTHEDVETVLALRTGRGKPLAETGHLQHRDGDVVRVLTCPGCAIRYASPAAELRARWIAARRRGEDVMLTAADRDHSPGVS